MSLVNQSFQDKLNNYALILRKYDLGDKDFFRLNFPKLSKSYIDDAWMFALRNIQHKDIIRNSVYLCGNDEEKIASKTSKFDNNLDTLYQYLISSLNVNRLSLSNKNTEIQVRKTIANKYLRLLKEDILEVYRNYKKSFRYKIHLLKIVLLYCFVLTFIIGALFGPRIREGLTPVNVLTEQIHEASKYEYRTGAICDDGWQSSATGSGACSHHGGVNKWIYETAYRKTIDECKIEAEKISWLK